MNKPQIRIKGFSGDEWVEKKLKDLCDKDSSCLTQGKLGESSGCYPVFGASGFVQNISKYSKDKDYIGIIKDGAGAGRVDIYPAFSSLLGTMQYILPNDNSEIYFLCNLLNNTDFSLYLTGSTIPHIYFKDYCEEVVYIPVDKKEQIYISAFFRSFDFLIHSTAKKIASLKQIKAASLQSMFPQNGETKPKVRFKGFEGEWEKKQLSDIFTERHIISTITKDLPQLSFTIAEGVIRPEDRKSNKRDFLIKDKDNKKYLVTYVDDIIYNPANVVFGAIHRNGLCNGVVSPIYKIFHTNYDSRFMECVVRHPEFISEMTNYTEGTVTKLKTLKPESFLKMSAIVTSSFDEQQKIGNYFAALNSQIDNLSKKLEKLKQIKSTCLDKMFV